jgi:TonB family protein
MTYGGRLGICAVASIASHLLLARGTAHLPPRVEAAPPAIVRVALRQTVPEPEPEPEKAPEARKEIPREVPMRRARTAVESTRPNPTKNLTPTERPDDSKNASDTPVFGISMESTSAAGSGPAFRVGNTLQTKPKARPSDADASGGRALAAPVPAYEVTKMPVPKGGQCPSGPYTDEAREAGLEGTVILTFVVDENGRVRDIKVLQGLGMGLTEAAKRAIAACPFVPGERNGQLVPTRVPAYKVRFTLRANE